MSEATIEYKNSPNESTAYAVTEGQKTKVQLVATPAGDLELADNPNVDTGYLVINGEKHKCALVAEVDGELKLPTSATDDTGYVTAQDGRQHKVKLVANITGGGEKTKFGASVDTWLGDVDENGVLQPTNVQTALNFAGVKEISDFGLANAFYSNEHITSADFSSVTKIGASGLSSAFNGSSLSSVIFSSLTTIGDGAFILAFNSCRYLTTISFPALVNVDTNSFGGQSYNTAFRLSNVKEIHFRADMQATIEATSQYANKWGATSATIYFDL